MHCRTPLWWYFMSRRINPCFHLIAINSHRKSLDSKDEWSQVPPQWYICPFLYWRCHGQLIKHLITVLHLKGPPCCWEVSVPVIAGCHDDALHLRNCTMVLFSVHALVKNSGVVRASPGVDPQVTSLDSQLIRSWITCNVPPILGPISLSLKSWWLRGWSFYLTNYTECNLITSQPQVTLMWHTMAISCAKSNPCATSSSALITNSLVLSWHEDSL